MERSPVGELRAGLWFLAGTVAGGAGIAMAVIWPLAEIARFALPEALRPWAGLAVVAVAAAAVAGAFELPRVDRQARQTLGELPPALGAFVFGVEIGAGIRTHTSSLALYLALVPVALGAGPAAIVAMGAAFGAARGLVPIDRFLRIDGLGWDQRLAAGSWVVRAAPALAAVAALGWAAVTAA